MQKLDEVASTQRVIEALMKANEQRTEADLNVLLEVARVCSQAIRGGRM